MYKVLKYSSEYKIQWNLFLQSAKNSSFLFNRDFMEYHSGRFEDYSLIIFNNNKIVGLIPANISNKQVYSHQGLTYGGLIVNREAKMNTILEIFYYSLKYLFELGIETFIYKSIPRIYNEIHTDETDWTFTILKAELFRRDSTLTIDQRFPLEYQDRRKRSIKKASALNPSIKLESFDFFWKQVLEPNMIEKHAVKPVHTLEEIKMLANKFPNNIKQYNIYVDELIMAGCTLFLNKTVAHAQYISGTEEGRKNGCLDYLFDYLIKYTCNNYLYFDFGICNEENGKKINHGLLDWKEGFGGRAISHDFYKIETKNYKLLNEVIKW